ncbi:MAG: type 1 glutamine amidotransferase [Betaproteobacteria bacterium]
MKPIAIFRHSAADGPAYLATFLQQQQIPYQEVRIDRGDPVPKQADAYAGIALMGGPMSVNDPLPWIADSLALIRDAVERDVPLIGHCLGGQLISKALGGAVTRNPNGKEIGWHQLHVADAALGRHWLGTDDGLVGFHWHGETFTLPTGASWLARSEACTNQAYVLGPHIGMQFHIEMDAPTIASWCDEGAPEVDAARSKPDVHPHVMTTQQIAERTPQHLPAMRAVAEHLYQRWVGNLRG